MYVENTEVLHVFMKVCEYYIVLSLFWYILVLRPSRMLFHLQVRPDYEGSVSETLARVYQSTRLHFPGDRDLEVCLVLVCPDELTFILSTLGGPLMVAQ
jgi:hypothetical protein